MFMNPEQYADLARTCAVGAKKPYATRLEHEELTAAAHMYAVKSIKARADLVLVNNKWVKRPLAKRKVT